MKVKSTYGQLNRMVADLQNLTLNMPGVAFIMHGQIENFYARNKSRINVLNTHLQYIADEHCKKDEAGKPILATNENGRQVLTFETPEKEKEFLKAYQEFLAKDIELSL